MAALMSDERSRLVSDAIDWPAERDIPHHVQTVIDKASVSNLSDSEFGNTGTLRQKREVVLTGATGFLGSEILRALLHDPSVSHIHCIAEIPGDQKQIQIFPGGSSRVFLYMGSLLSPTLGLSPDQIQYIQGCMSQIIHAGAQGHCLNNHTSLRSANLLSTQTLATWAIPRRAPLHFIPSGRVIIQPGPVRPTPNQGRRILHQPTGLRDSQLPIIGDRATFDDAMNSVLRFSRLSRTVPLVPNAEGFFDFHDIAEVARAIAQDQTHDSRMCFRHHSIDVRITFDQVASRMANLHGGHIEKVDLAAWIRRARDLGMEELIASYLEANVAGGGRLRFPYLDGTHGA